MAACHRNRAVQPHQQLSAWEWGRAKASRQTKENCSLFLIPSSNLLCAQSTFWRSAIACNAETTPIRLLLSDTSFHLPMQLQRDCCPFQLLFHLFIRQDKPFKAWTSLLQWEGPSPDLATNCLTPEITSAKLSENVMGKNLQLSSVNYHDCDILLHLCTGPDTIHQ